MDELISAVEKMRRVQMDYEASHRNPYFAKEKKRLEAVVDEIVRKHKEANQAQQAHLFDQG